MQVGDCLEGGRIQWRYQCSKDGINGYLNVVVAKFVGEFFSGSVGLDRIGYLAQCIQYILVCNRILEALGQFGDFFAGKVIDKDLEKCESLLRHATG